MWQGFQFFRPERISRGCLVLVLFPLQLSQSLVVDIPTINAILLIPTDWTTSQTLSC